MESLLFSNFIMGLVILGCSSSASVKVIHFQNEFATSGTESQENVHQESLETRNLTVCATFMPRYYRGYFLLHTPQWKLKIRGLEGFVILYPFNVTSAADHYSRMISFCHRCVPGKWTSMCLTMELTETTQRIQVFQNGQLCFSQTYSDGEFDSIHYRESPPIYDL